MPLFAFFYECPVKVVNVFSLKRVVCFLFCLECHILHSSPMTEGAVIINASELFYLLSYTDSVDLCL